MSMYSMAQPKSPALTGTQDSNQVSGAGIPTPADKLQSLDSWNPFQLQAN